MTSCAQMKNGKRMNVMPGVRSCTIVTMVLTDPTIEDVASRNRPASHAVWPIVAMSASGGYDVHPDCAAPPGRKKPAIITRPPARYSQ